MSFVKIAVILCICSASLLADSQPLRPNMLLDGGQVLLPNGWKITPAGKATKLPGEAESGTGSKKILH